jgi:peptidyl-prolyl cis-trans isomerase B (cyclophilin B)
MELLLILLLTLGQARPAKPPAPPPQPVEPTFFTSPLSLEEMRGKQAVMETTMGTVVMQLLPESAPNHVGFFITQARAGEYDGTIFHRVVRYGMIQGGDPISRDPSRADEYGSGGGRRLRAESRDERHTAGAVSAVLFPGDPDSAGMQFFICATDQPTIDGQYTVFARVVEGLEVVQAISTLETDAEGLPHERVVIKSLSIRDTPVEPFTLETDAELAAYKTVIETTMGTIELEMLPDKAPRTVRAFLQMVAAGVYDGIAVHRVAPNFVIQTGALYYRDRPLRASQQRLIGNLPPEFTDTPNEPGVVSMARGAEPDSGSTSFFICTGSCRSLDNQYTVFARVITGMDVVKAITGVRVDGEMPVTPIVMRRVYAAKR